MSDAAETVSFRHATIENACIQYSDSPGPEHKGAAFVGGFVPVDAGQHAALRQTRDRRPVDAFAANAKYDFRMDGTYLYGGLLYGHFGHMMSEMVHRVLTTRQYYPERPWIFVGMKKPAPLLGFHQLPGCFKSALAFLQVAREDVLCLHAHAQVERLCIAEQGSDQGSGPRPGYLALLNAYSEARLQALFPEGSPYRRVYVSKTMLPHGGSFLGERYLESLLAEEGFTIFHPQEHDLAWQMEVYRRSEIIIFPEGSACHGVELLGGKTMGTCVYLERRKFARHAFHNILRPRAERFISLEGSPEIGTAARNPANGAPLHHIGVWVYDTDRLLQCFRENDVARLPRFSVAAYLATCHRDLLAYFSRFGDPAAPGENAAVFAKLTEALEALC